MKREGVGEGNRPMHGQGGERGAGPGGPYILVPQWDQDEEKLFRRISDLFLCHKL